MPTPIDQLIAPDECDVPIYAELRDEFLSETKPTRARDEHGRFIKETK